MKILVMYYSFEGNTKKIAELIGNCIGADVEEIKPKQELKSRGFLKYLWGGRQVIMGTKPELMPINKDINDYDLVFVGTPIWAGTYAPPIKTLIEEGYIKNKKIAYFYTHEGGHGKAVEKAKMSIEVSNLFIGAKDFRSHGTDFEQQEETVKKWANEIVDKCKM